MPKKKTIQPVKQVTTTAKDQVEYVPLSDVKLWAENPRKNSGAVSKLAEQIKTHGFRIPIVVWKKDMVIYAGNTRYKAAKKLGMEKIPVVFAPFKSKADAVAFGLSDNKSHEWSEWDDDTLSELMKADTTLTAANTGFSDQELFAFRRETPEKRVRAAVAAGGETVQEISVPESLKKDVLNSLVEWFTSHGFRDVRIEKGHTVNMLGKE